MTRPTTAPPTAGPASPGRHTGSATRHSQLTLIAMCLGAAMTFLEITTSIIGLSSIQAALRVSSANSVWIVSAYTLLVASLVLCAGTLGNKYGRKKAFSVGIIILAVGSVLVAGASGITLVIIGQAVAGVGGALILPNSVALLGLAYPDPHKRTEAITIWAASSGIGLAAGPIISGILLNHFSWHAIFLANPVLAVIALALTIPVVAESRQAGAGRLDLAGVALGTLTIAALVYGLIEGGHQGYTSPKILTAFAISAIAAVALVVTELRVPAPMLDVRLFRSFSFSSVIVVGAVSLFGFAGMSLLEVLFLQKVQHLSPLDSGLRLLVLFGPYILVAGLSGRVIRRVGFKLPLAGGLIVAGIASILLTGQHAETSFATTWWLFAVFGAASGFVVAPSTAAAMVSVNPHHAGMASGSVNTARQVGTVLGTSILGTLLTTRLASDLPLQLAAHGVPIADRGSIASAVAAGATGNATLPAGAREAIADAFTSGVHAGVVANGIVFLAASILVLVGIRNRPHHQTAAQSPDPANATPDTSAEGGRPEQR